MHKKRIFPIIPCLTFLLGVVLAISALAQSIPLAPVLRQPPRAPGQKSIEEVWHELETSTFQISAFDELGTLHR